MPVVYLRHPLHGEKVESNDAIAQLDRENGWVEFYPTPASPSIPSFFLSSIPVSTSDLPVEFPGRAALIEGGLPMWADVVGKTVEQLYAIRGIGEPTARKIIAVMES